MISMNELLYNSIIGDQSGIELLPGIDAASLEWAIISQRVVAWL